MKKKRKTKSLTIVSVTGHSSYTVGSIYAIQKSYLELKDHIPDLKCLLISPDRPVDLFENIQHIPTKPFSYLEYNLFILYALDQYIDTDYALIVQEDGWILNGKAWTDEFFNYDYIGAPIPMYFSDDEEHKFYDSEFWLNNHKPIPEGLIEPQNGGVSLRSKKLLGLPNKLGLNYKLPKLNICPTLPFEFKWENNNHNEDLFLTVIHRKALIENGIKFCPRELAIKFSVESFFMIADGDYNGKYDISEGNVKQNDILASHFPIPVAISGLNQVSLNYQRHFSEEMLHQDPFLYYFIKLGYSVIIPAQFSFTGKEIRVVKEL